MVTLLLFFRRLLYWTLGTFDALTGRATHGVVVFCYHGISADGKRYSLGIEAFRKQIEILAQKFRFISLEDLEQIITGTQKLDDELYAVVTFDDGHAGLKDIVEIVDAYNVKPAVFVLTEFDKLNVDEIEDLGEVLSNRAIRNLARSGWTIGSHGNRHYDLTKLTDAEVKYEIFDSKVRLEKILGSEVRYFAFPYGKYNDSVLEYVDDAGYSMSLTMDDGVVNERSRSTLIPRVGVDRTHALWEFSYLWSPSVLTFRDWVKTSMRRTGLFDLGMNLLFR